MKDVISILQQLCRVLWYQAALAGVRVVRFGHSLLWDGNRVCKEDGCHKLLFAWHNGKYCWKHSHSHRVHTVLVILGKSPK